MLINRKSDISSAIITKENVFLSELTKERMKGGVHLSKVQETLAFPALTERQ